MTEFDELPVDSEVPAWAKPYLRLWAAKLLIHTKDYAAGKKALGSKPAWHKTDEVPTLVNTEKDKPKRINPDVIKAAIEAQDWITDDAYRVGSFIWVCEVFGLNPVKVRSHVLHGWRDNLGIRI